MLQDLEKKISRQAGTARDRDTLHFDSYRI